MRTTNTGEAPDRAAAADDLNVNERLQRAQKWVDAARWVIEQTGNSEAQNLLAFFESRPALLTPLVGDSRVYYPPGKTPGAYEDYVYLAPLLIEDSKRLPANDPRQLIISCIGGVARYTEGSQAIYLTPHILPRPVKGMVLLRELKHAHIDIKRLTDRSQPNAHWTEEADVFILEFELLSKLGGVAYRRLLEDSVAAIQPLKDRPTAIAWNWDHLEDRLVATCTGMGIKGRMGRRVISSVRMFHAYWQYAQKNYDDPHGALAMFLKHKYAQVEQGKA